MRLTPERQLSPPDVPNLTHADANAIQAELEQIAMREWDTLDRCAVEWMLNAQDPEDLAGVVMALATADECERGDMALRAWRLQQDYVQHRIATASEIERADVEQKLRDEMEIDG